MDPVRPLVMIVRRGAIERFRFLQEAFAQDPVLILWDRRVSERRRRTEAVTLERRHQKRRGPPPISWVALDFLIVRESREAIPDRDSPTRSSLSH